MRLPPPVFTRLVMFAAVGLTALAVSLGRSAPEATIVRHPAPVRYQAINWYLFRQNDPAPRFLDAETGRLTRFAFPGSGGLEYAACAPWSDERGESQIVGLWNGTAGKSGGNISLGLARFTFPGQQILDRVPLDIIPSSHPCWYPGTEPTVLFGATNGQLYRLAFAETRAAAGDTNLDANRPRRLVWRCTPPGAGETWINDPSWPAEPRLGGKLLVALRYRQPLDPERRFSRAGLWWLQLSAEGTEIEAAARLTQPDPDAEEHWPVLASNPAGALTLAYLERHDDRSGWRLRLATITIDPATGIPHAGPPWSVSPDRVCLPTPPVFSPDGRWVHVLPDATPSPVRVDRLAVITSLAEKATSDEPIQGD